MTRAHIRWMIRHDMPEVLEIENESFEFPWTEEDFIRCLQQRNCIGMVAEHGEQVVGFMIYELHKSRLHVLNFSVAPSQRRRGVGEQMIDKLKSKLTATKRSRIELVVRERNLAAQLFWRANGFQAVEIVRDHYDDTDEDGYRFEWRLPSVEPDKRLDTTAGRAKQQTSTKPVFHNRLTGRFKEDANDVGFE